MSVAEARKYYYDNGYLKATNFINKELLKYLQYSLSITTNENVVSQYWGYSKNNDIILSKNKNLLNADITAYGTIIGDTLLAYCAPYYSKIIGKRLMPSYSFMRIYQKTQTLESHTDRPSCQYSITVPLCSSAARWPFFVKDGEKETVKVTMNVGDAVLYMGERVSHWREALEEDLSHNIFLHYVDADDLSYAPYIYDGRLALGLSANSRN